MKRLGPRPAVGAAKGFEPVTCLELASVAQGMARLSRALTFVRQDIHRETRGHVRPIYLLDFSDLHAYLWPDSSHSQHKAVIQYLLDSSKLTFTLPPGALLELYAHLDEQQSKHRRGGRTVAEALSRPMVSAFVDAVLRKGSDVPTPQPFGPATTAVLGAISEATESDKALWRLQALYDSGRLTPLEDHIANKPDAVPDRAAFQTALHQLRVARSGRPDITNVIDAHNYAITVRLNDLYYKKHSKLFLLVTSSPTPFKIFDSLKWEGDPDYPGDAEPVMRTTLARHPVQLLYRAHFVKAPVSQRLHQLDRARAALSALREELTRSPVYREYKSGRIPDEAPIRLPANRTFLSRMARFTKFYWEAYRPTADLLATDESLEFNRRLLRHVSSERIGGTLWASEERSQNSETVRSVQPLPITYRFAIGLFDRIIDQSRAQLARVRREVRGFSPEALRTIDPEGHFVGTDNIRLERRESASLECVEVEAVLTNQKDASYLNADVYPKYLAMWWRTNISFREFAAAAQRFKEMREAEPNGSEAAAGAGRNCEERRAYAGVTFVTDRDVIRRDLEPDGDLAEQLIALAEPEWDLRLVRLALNDADLCYDVAPSHPYPQRAGIVTAGAYGEAVLAYARWTNSMFVQERAVSKALRAIWKELGKA